MRSVVQEHNYGCGIACVAFIAKLTYKYALGSSQQKADTAGFSCKELVTLLEQFGKEYRYNYLKPRLKNIIYKDFTIVFVARSKRFPIGHYLVRYEGRWMDPWINFPSDIKQARAGFRKRLPGRPIYAVFPQN